MQTVTGFLLTVSRLVLSCTYTWRGLGLTVHLQACFCEVNNLERETLVDTGANVEDEGTSLLASGPPA